MTNHIHVFQTPHATSEPRDTQVIHLTHLFYSNLPGIRGDSWTGDIALDDISFTGCTLEPLCAEDAFTCGGLQCIHKEELCDFIPQCNDGSDEANCGMFFYNIVFIFHIYINIFIQYVFKQRNINNRNLINNFPKKHL